MNAFLLGERRPGAVARSGVDKWQGDLLRWPDDLILEPESGVGGASELTG